MAEEPEKSGQEPNLELPSLLGFGRRKKRRQGDAVPQEPVAEAEPAAAEPPAEAAPAAESTEPLAADPVPEPRGGLAPAADRAKRLPPVPPPPRAQAAPVEPGSSPPQAEPEPTEPTEPVEPVVVHETPVVDEPAVIVAPPEVEAPADETPIVVTPPPPRAEPRSEPVSDPTSAVEETSVLPDGLGTPPLPDEPVENHEEPLGWPEEDPEEPETDQGAAVGPAPGSRRAGRASRSLSLPVINPRLAAAVTGALVGLSGVLLAFVSQRGCELVRGVGSCGGIGLLALLVILAVEVMIGAVLLKAWRLSDPASTSFLGVGLMAVFVLLFLLSSLESVWMLLVIPVVSALAFLVSWWVTTTFVEGVVDDRFSR